MEKLVGLRLDEKYGCWAVFRDSVTQLERSVQISSEEYAKCMKSAIKHKEKPKRKPKIKQPELFEEQQNG